MAEFNPNPDLLDRLYLLLRTAMRQPIVSADDAVLADEFFGLRKGNAKLVGVAFSLAHRRDWIQPLPNSTGHRHTKKSARKRRARGSSELWTRTDRTQAALAKVEKMLTHRPKPPDLFADYD